MTLLSSKIENNAYFIKKFLTKTCLVYLALNRMLQLDLQNYSLQVNVTDSFGHFAPRPIEVDRSDSKL